MEAEFHLRAPKVLCNIDLSDRIVLLGQGLFTTAVSSRADRAYLKQAFGLLCDELHLLEHASRQKQMMLIPAAFVVLYNQMSPSGMSAGRLFPN